MDPLRSRLEQLLAGQVATSASVPIVSTVTGAPIDGAALNPVYWGRNLREPVRFRQAIETLLANGLRSFLELAPHPLLAAQVRQMGPDATVVSPLRRGRADAATLRAALIPLAVDTRPERDGRRPRHLLLLSACSSAALEEMRLRWAARLPQDWPDLCHTALVGRERFPWRLALHAADGEDARGRLLDGSVLRGHAVPGALPPFDQIRGTDESWSDHLDRCAAAFVAGAEIDGTLFDADEPWRVVSAPTYPFERERHWLPVADAGLSYAVGWEPFVPAGLASADQTEEARAAWPDVPVVADAPDPGLDAEATAFAHAALATVPAVAPRYQALAERFAGWSWQPPVTAAEGPIAALLRRAGQALPALLAGEADPLEALFPGGDIEAAAAVYQSAPFAASQRALALTIGALGRPLRVLELGAGTGALTAQLLPLLPAGSTLLCSDVSDAFLAALRRRFAADWPTLRTMRFDLDDPPALDRPVDVIVAANVVHAGASLPDILPRLRGLLVPGGTLGLVELLRAPRWIDLVFGLTDGWWDSAAISYVRATRYSTRPAGVARWPPPVSPTSRSVRTATSTA